MTNTAAEILARIAVLPENERNATQQRLLDEHFDRQAATKALNTQEAAARIADR